MERQPDVVGIFNYCTRRCNLCEFTARCSLYRSEREYEARHPDASLSDRLHDAFAESRQMIEEYCAREGIDFAQICREATDEKAIAESDRADALVRADPLQTLAEAYMHGALNVTEAVALGRGLRRWPPEVDAAFDTITWHATMIAAKVHRALHGHLEHDESFEDPVQNDWNGSAKLARVLTDESARAWGIVMRAGETPEGSELHELVAQLERIDRALVERFPDAPSFQRPGFDDDASTSVGVPAGGRHGAAGFLHVAMPWLRRWFSSRRRWLRAMALFTRRERAAPKRLPGSGKDGSSSRRPMAENPSTPLVKPLSQTGETSSTGQQD